MHPRRLPSPSTVALAVLLLLPAACDRAPGGETTGHGAPQAAARPAEAPLPPALPPEGEVVVEVSESGLLVLANRAPRIALLEALEKALGFELVLGRMSAEQRGAVVTLSAVDASLEDVLRDALEGVPFQVHYAVDAARGGHLVARVQVAGERGFRKDRRRRGDGDERLSRREKRSERLQKLRAKLPPPEERERLAAERAEEAARLIDSSDAAARARAAEDLAVDTAGVSKLGQVLEGDPDPEVRVAAAERLGDADSFEAVQQLLGALHDPEPQVVIAALDALEFVGDESVVPQLGFLLKHPDPAVREAAVGAIEFLE